jgi:hypothetical protein
MCTIEIKIIYSWLHVRPHFIYFLICNVNVKIAYHSRSLGANVFYRSARVSIFLNILCGNVVCWFCWICLRLSNISSSFIGSENLCIEVIMFLTCPTRYRTRHFCNNFTVSQQLGAPQTHTTDTSLFISHTTNVSLIKFRCNIFIGVRIIKEMPGSVASGTPYVTMRLWLLKEFVQRWVCLLPLVTWFFFHKNICVLDRLFFTDVTTFHLIEYIHSQKSRIMSAENPHALRKIPVHSFKIGAWCTVSRKCLGNEVWEHCYLKKQLLTKIIQFLLLESLPYWKRTNWVVAFRKMGSEPILKYNNSFLVRLLRWSHLSGEVFGCHDPQNLSHLTSFFPWGFHKGTVCSNKPTSVMVLTHNIQKAVACSEQQIFRKVANYTQKGECLSSRR